VNWCFGVVAGECLDWATFGGVQRRGIVGPTPGNFFRPTPATSPIVHDAVMGCMLSYMFDLEHVSNCM
jgi:hypothetical protein